MKRFQIFLSERTVLAVLLITVYYLLVVLMHEQISNFFIQLVEGVKRNVYQRAVLSVGLVFLVIYVFFIIRNIIIRQWKRSIIFYLFFTLVFVVLSFQVIIVHNVETIHFAQYAGLAILLYPIVKRFGDTVFWCTILGAIDETYQYLVLNPLGTDYFDFNDIVLNLIGGGLGVLLLFSTGFYIFRTERKAWYKSLVNIALIVLTIAIGILLLTSTIQYYPAEDGTAGHLILIKEQLDGFWKEVPSLNTRFHVLRPLYGMIIIILLGLFYSSMDRVVKSIQT